MSNLSVLPNTGFAPNNESIVKHLREQADWIESGRYSGVQNIFLIIEGIDGTLNRQTCGAICDRARAVGILTIAAIHASIGTDA